jgi:type I restriction enzyme, S subunit
MKDWNEDIFDNFIRLKRGYDLPNQNIVPGKYPIIASTTIKDYHNAYKVKPPGVVTGRSGSLGTVQYISEKFWPLNTTLYAIDYKGNFPRYVYYFLKTMHLENLNSGAGVPTLNQNHLHKLKIKIPSIKIQIKISAILSAYDDLIENNKRRITLLEKMAEEIYREWFVRMRFPGHEKVKFKKGVPEEWKVKKIGELVSTQYGYTASAGEEEIGPKFLRITDIVPDVIDWESVPYCKIEGKNEKKYLLNEGDIVVARTGATVGFAKRINKNHPRSVFASYLVRLVPKNVCDSIFLGMAVESDSFKKFIGMFITGAAQPQANASIMSLFTIYYPVKNIIGKFNKTVEPIINLKEKLCAKNTLIKRSRDLLLPRLISGKLPVGAINIQFPTSMQDEQDIVHA